MFAGLKKLSLVRANGSLANGAAACLLVLGMAASLVARPDADSQTKGHVHHPIGVHHHHDGDHLHQHHSHSGSHIDSLRAAENEQAQAFSFGSFFGFHDVTLENFPVEPVAALAKRVAA